MQQQRVIVGHLAPDLDCITAIWILLRHGNAADAELQFVASGQTLGGRPADADPAVIHVDTGGGRFDHHQHAAADVCAAELVRRVVAPNDIALERMVQQVVLIDHARGGGGDSAFFHINALIGGFNSMFPTQPHQVALAMLPNLDAWYEHELRQIRLEDAFRQRIEFDTPWGLGIAMESDEGGSSKLAYGHGAVLYAYRDANGWMGVAAQSRSYVDLSPVYRELRVIDTSADWYLHPNKRLLLCGTAKAPPRTPSQLSLVELVEVIENQR